MHKLSKRQVADLVKDRFEGDWEEPAWSLGELVYYWGACLEMEGGMDPEQVVCWVGSFLIEGEMIRRGHTGLANLDLWMDQFHALQKVLSKEEWVAILGETFRPI